VKIFTVISGDWIIKCGDRLYLDIKNAVKDISE